MVHNVFGKLIPNLVSGVATVPRTYAGSISACTVDGKTESAHAGQEVAFAITGPAQVRDTTQAITASESGFNTPNRVIEMGSDKGDWFTITKEMYKGLEQNNPLAMELVMAKVMEAMQARTQDIAAKVTEEMRKNAGRAYVRTTAGDILTGTTGTKDITELQNLLDEGGAGEQGRCLLTSTRSYYGLMDHPNVARADAVGDFANRSIHEDGILARTYNVTIKKEKALNSLVTIPADPAYLVNEADGYAVGDTAITVNTGGNAGALPAGTPFGFGATPSEYYVSSTALAGATGTLTLARPGLKEAIDDNDPITVSGAGNRLFAIAAQKASTFLAVRGAQHEVGAANCDFHKMMADPYTGLVYSFASYQLFKERSFYVDNLFAVRTIRPEFIVVGYSSA